MKLDKTQIARRQLGTALALFLQDADPVSVHTLACAGGEIAENLTAKAGVEPFSTHVLATFSELDPITLRTIRNQYWNAFKHATTRNGLDRQDEELLKRFSDHQNDHALFIGWYDYMMATETMPVEAQAFQAWYMALYPEKIDPAVDNGPSQKLFPSLKTRPRAEQKAILQRAIEFFGRDPEIINDPRTDKKPLILPNEPDRETAD